MDEIKVDLTKAQHSDERKTALIEELHEKLAKSGEQNSALIQSLRESESAEQALRRSLER